MNRSQLFKMLILGFLLIFNFSYHAEDVTKKQTLFTENTSGSHRVLTIRAINAIEHTVLDGDSEWKLINQATNKVISFKGKNTATEINIYKEFNEIKDGKGVTSGQWMLSGISGEFTGLSVIEVSADDNQLVEVNMHHKIAKIKIDAPTKAIAGTVINVTWHKPSTIDGKITLQKSGDKPFFHAPPEMYTKNYSKPKAELRLPTEPGEYILRFYNVREQEKIVTKRSLRIEAAKITLNAPKEAIAGTEIDLSWVAPETSSARINLSLPASKPRFTSLYTVKTKDKTSGKLLLPSYAGDYVLRWHNSYDKQVVFERPIKLLPQRIILNTPQKVEAGSKLELSWDAPARSQGKVYIVKVDEDKKTRPKYIKVKGKTKGILEMPNQPGKYLIRWQNENDKKIVVENPIEIILSMDKTKKP